MPYADSTVALSSSTNPALSLPLSDPFTYTEPESLPVPTESASSSLPYTSRSAVSTWPFRSIATVRPASTVGQSAESSAWSCTICPWPDRAASNASSKEA